MPEPLTAPFTLDLWEGDADPSSSDPTAPATAHVALAKTYGGGDIEGSARGHALTTRGERGASYVAQERIEGTVLGRLGSFVLEHGARMGGDTVPEQWAVVVTGSGTGELAAISGRGKLDHGLLSLEVSFGEG